ncbi:MAG: DUF4012 domain-containing protein [Candidatus Moranbacteria bacterium]|nr:DUF4012 domain-containing protein [Candidatus Moranbacteria bacterium]
MENKNNACPWMGRNKINLRMSDVRPANQDGGSPMGGIGRTSGSGPQSREYRDGVVRRTSFGDIRRPGGAISRPAPVWQEKNGLLGYPVVSNDSVRIKIEKKIEPRFLADKAVKPNQTYTDYADEVEDMPAKRMVFSDAEDLKDIPSRRYKKIFFSFAGVAASIFLVIAGTGFFNKGMGVKNDVMGIGQDAYTDLAMARDGIAGRDFQKSSFEFGEAYDKFGEISQDINSLGGILVETSRFIPFFSKISSGDHIAQVGKDVSRIGILASGIMQSLDAIKNPLNGDADPSVSFLRIFQDTDNNLKEISILMQDVQDNLDKVNIDDIPEDRRVQFLELKSQLPETNRFLTEFISNSQIFTDVLGGNGMRKYLFLFQNNQEMRATGGFIGTYGVLDIFNGNVRNFFIDGIYNPDGQLREKVIPPVPIQKISAAWSLHDSNWFPDFPKSAEKAAWFYEKTGGPTVDGVITMTPTVMQKMLEITGPIELPEYGVTVDKDNFVEKIQYEVEVDYDKELNKPKQILADLAPKILDKLFNARNFSDIVRTMSVLSESLDEKQILIYSKNSEIEKVLSEQGWSGEILDTQKDYVSVVNTNINGYKTDGVVDEKIEHRAEIQSDGSVVDTLIITRHHNGGSLDHDWWNKVNADYMRVYVPKGSILLSAEGQTREYNTPPLDYHALAFKQDAQVRMEEDSLEIDEESGTKIYEDSGKTVFANWVYVSPQETVVIKYKYLLPFKLGMDGKGKPADAYSLLAQKQAGSLGSAFTAEIAYPDNYKMVWNYPEKVRRENNNIKIESDLKTDKFVGAAFTQR